MVNNFKQITQFLKFDSEDDFYHLQILKRKKENPEIGSNSYVIRTYCIRSKEHLVEKMDEIINLCIYNNARAYINLNRRSFERIAFHTLKKISDIIMNKDYKSVRNAFESVCGEYGSGKDKYWIIDVDTPGIDGITEINSIIYDINSNCKPDGDKDKMVVETKNGYHLIVSAFNLSQSKIVGKYDIHKNNPTILFCN